MMIRYALGVDVGGTKISVTLGDSRGKIHSKELLPTLTGKKARQGIDGLTAALQHLKECAPRGKKLSGIGIGIPGPMDPHRGIVQRSPHLAGWEGVPLKSRLEKKLKLPVFITNDANAAAVGEKVFGAGRRAENFVYLTISTGIGGGIVLGGKLLVGTSFGAGEVGHAIIVPGGERCGCGGRGCLEAYASGTAIANFVKRQTREGRRLPFTGAITAEKISEAAGKGNTLSMEAFRRAGYYLGIGLANLINLLNPEMLILGGSVMKSSPLLWPSLARSVKANAWPSLAAACRIVKTGLGGQVGDLGALALVFARWH